MTQTLERRLPEFPDATGHLGVFVLPTPVHYWMKATGQPKEMFPFACRDLQKLCKEADFVGPSATSAHEELWSLTADIDGVPTRFFIVVYLGVTADYAPRVIAMWRDTPSNG